MAKKSATTTVSAKETTAAQSTRKGAKPAQTPATPAPQAKTAQSEPKEAKASKYRGVTSKMRVMEYQDHTLAINDQANRRLTDEELVADWQREFPEAVKFTLAHVRGVRALYNAGKHRKGADVPETPSQPYTVENGKRTLTVYTRARAAKPQLAVSNPTPKAAAKSAKAEPAKATTTVKVRKAKTA